MTSTRNRAVKGNRIPSSRGVTSSYAGDDGAQIIFDELPIAVGFGAPVQLHPRRLSAVPALPVDFAGAPAARKPGRVIELHLPSNLGDAHPVNGLGTSGLGTTSASCTGSMLEPAALRLTARGRGLLLAAAAAVGIAVVVAAWFGAGSTAASARSARPAQVVVHDGDTLWSIAGRIAPNRDPRAIVAELLRINRLDSPALVPGQVLRTH